MSTITDAQVEAAIVAYVDALKDISARLAFSDIDTHDRIGMRAALEAALSVPVEQEARGYSTEAVLRRDVHHFDLRWVVRGIEHHARIYEPQRLPVSAALADVLALAVEEGHRQFGVTLTDLRRAAALASPAPAATVPAAEIEQLRRDLSLAVEALEQAQTWHEAEDKALSKQPPSYGPTGNQWARLQHREQIDTIAATLRALKHKEAGR